MEEEMDRRAAVQLLYQLYRWERECARVVSRDIARLPVKVYGDPQRLRQWFENLKA